MIRINIDTKTNDYNYIVHIDESTLIYNRDTIELKELLAKLENIVHNEGVVLVDGK
jgi:hypothetical protein